MLNWSKIRIGYRPNHKDLSGAGDRRRFVFYAKERGISFEIADPSKQYDVLYLTYGCNITQWMAYKKANPNTKIVFEMVDSYLLEGVGFFVLSRGIVRFITKRESKLYLNYKNAIRKMISVCDAIVCSTPIQMEGISQYNKNVHISLDYFSDDITQYKTSYKSSGKLKLVWEGQGYTVRNLLAINDALGELKDEIELHIVTDPILRFPIKIFNKKTSRILSGLKCEYHIYNWTRQSFSEIITSSDLAIIPISGIKMMRNKPENKLLLLWEMGIPVLTSDTPAYERVMDKAGLDFYCRNNEEWVRKIRRYKEDTEDKRKSYMSTAAKYLRENHTKDIILKKWDAIFDSVLIDTENISLPTYKSPKNLIE